MYELRGVIARQAHIELTMMSCTCVHKTTLINKDKAGTVLHVLKSAINGKETVPCFKV